MLRFTIAGCMLAVASFTGFARAADAAEGRVTFQRDVLPILAKHCQYCHRPAAEMIRYHMELRGIGIINIKNLFGVSAVRTSKSIELVIELERWDPSKKYDRLGLDGETYSILGRTLPFLRLPVASGRNLALLIEIGARNELLKMQGYDAAKEFALKVDEQIAKNAKSPALRRR